MKAMLYIAASECARQLLPKFFRRLLTVCRYFAASRNAGFFIAINTALAMSLREV
jgi:hypothetical protein